MHHNARHSMQTRPCRLREAFCRWQSLAQQQATLGSVQATVTTVRISHLLQFSLAAWRVQLQVTKDADAACAREVHVTQQRGLSRAFAVWLQNSVQLQVRRRKTQQHCRHMTHFRIRRCLATWQSWAHKHVCHTRLLVRFQRRRASKCCHGVLVAWQQRVLAVAAACHILHKVQKRLHLASLQLRFLDWSDAVNCCRHVRAMQHARKLSSLRSCFALWLQASVVLRMRRCRYFGMVQAHERRALCATLRGWRSQAAQHWTRRRAAAERLLKVIAHHSEAVAMQHIAATFAVWRQTAQGATAAAVQQETAMAQVRFARLRRLMLQWHGVVAATRRQYHQADCMWLQRQQRLVHLCWDKWQAWLAWQCCKRLQQYRAATFSLRRMLKQCTLAWRSFAEHRHVKRVQFQRAAHRLQSSLLARVMTSWLAAHRRSAWQRRVIHHWRLRRQAYLWVQCLRAWHAIAHAATQHAADAQQTATFKAAMLLQAWHTLAKQSSTTRAQLAATLSKQWQARAAARALQAWAYASGVGRAADAVVAASRQKLCRKSMQHMWSAWHQLVRLRMNQVSGAAMLAQQWDRRAYLPLLLLKRSLQPPCQASHALACVVCHLMRICHAVVLATHPLCAAH